MRALFGVTSTAISGLTSILVQLFAAALLGPSEFARFSICAATVIFCLGFGRAVVAQVDMIRGPSVGNSGPGEACFLLSLIFTGLGLVITVTGGAVLANGTAFLIGLGVLCSGVHIIQDNLRFRAFRRNESHLALLGDSVTLAGAVAAFGLSFFTPLNAIWFLILWTLAALSGAVVAAIGLKVLSLDVTVGRDWIRRQRDLIGPGVGEFLLQAGLPYALNFVILAVGGDSAFAGYRLGQLIFAGIGNFANGLNAVMLPRLVESQSPSLARRYLLREIAVLSLVSGLLATLVLMLPLSIGEGIFGGNWSSMGPFLVVCAVHGWINGLAVPTFSLFRLIGFARMSLFVRMGSAAATLCLAWLAAMTSEPVAVAWAIAVPAVGAWIVRASVSLATVRRLERSEELISSRGPSDS